MAERSRLFLFVFIFCYASVCYAVERHSIKIVDEPSNYGMMNNYGGGGIGGVDSSSVLKLKMRITPSNFSGPLLMQRLVGKCFSKTDDSYKYELCPFSNVTQHEQSLRWNPYSGILGVWQEWEIINNTFVAMVMREGDKCNNQFRTVKVYFVCDKENKLLNVSEPSTCNYHLNFSTPYVCHRQSMLVYPTLSKELQTEWGLLEGELARGEVTNKGYKKYLNNIFVRAGYMISADVRQQISAGAVSKEKKAAKQHDGRFDNLYQCSEAYRNIKKELDDLKALVEMNKEHAGNVIGDDYQQMMHD